MSRAPAGLTVLPVDGVGEVRGGDDLAALLLAALGPTALRDGDVVVVTSKVVSKAEGRSARGDRAAHLAGETDRVVATRGHTTIVRTRHGLVLAGAGIDASNTEPGHVLLLPVDPDASARSLRERIHRARGVNVAVVLTDTAGRAWRGGQTDLAVGAAGLEVLVDYDGRRDHHGNELSVTAPAVADEIAAAGDLVKGKLARRPAAVARGLADLVLPPGEHGPGARALVRPESHDLFGYGAREAVLRALRPGEESLRGFGAPADAGEVAVLLDRVVGTAATVEGDLVLLPLPEDPRSAGRAEVRAEAAAFSVGWVPHAAEAPATHLRFRAGTP